VENLSVLKDDLYNLPPPITDALERTEC